MAQPGKQTTNIKPNPWKVREAKSYDGSKLNVHYHYGPQYHYHGQSNQQGTNPRPPASSTVVVVNKNAAQTRPNKPQPHKVPAVSTSNKGGFQKSQSTHRPQGHNHSTAPVVKKNESPKCQSNPKQQYHKNSAAANTVVVVNKSGQHKRATAGSTIIIINKNR